MVRLVAVALCIALTGCTRDVATSDDPIHDVINQTPVGTVGRFVFRDKVIVVNRTASSLSRCVFVIDDAIRGELGELQPATQVTLMRTRFRPYLDAEPFYARGSKASRLECLSSGQPVAVVFGAQTEHTVRVPPKE